MASVDVDITHEALVDIHDAGVRGVRFIFVKRLADATPPEVFIALADKIQEFGWSIVVYFEAVDLEELEPFLKKLPGIVVVDQAATTAIREIGRDCGAD